MSISESAKVHPYAQIHPSAEISIGAVVGALAVVEKGAVVRTLAVVEEGAVVRALAVVEEGAVVRASAIVGSGAIVRAGADIAAGADITTNLTITLDPLVLQGLRWRVTITDAEMRIGCEQHTLAEWEAFSDRRIAIMHRDALTFWKAHKDMLLGLARANGREW